MMKLSFHTYAFVPIMPHIVHNYKEHPSFDCDPKHCGLNIGQTNGRINFFHGLVTEVLGGPLECKAKRIPPQWIRFLHESHVF
jgi:hypothetical protein